MVGADVVRLISRSCFPQTNTVPRDTSFIETASYRVVLVVQPPGIIRSSPQRGKFVQIDFGQIPFDMGLSKH